MSRISSIVSTPVSDRIRMFDSSPSTPKRIPKVPEKSPVKEKMTLETPKLRPVPRQQFTIKDPPPGVKAFLNPKLSSPATTKSKDVPAKTDLKSSKSETPSTNNSKPEVGRSTRVRSTSTARSSTTSTATVSKTTPDKGKGTSSSTIKKPVSSPSPAVPGGNKKPGQGSNMNQEGGNTSKTSARPTVSRSNSTNRTLTRTPSVTRGQSSTRDVTRAPSMNRGSSISRTPSMSSTCSNSVSVSSNSSKNVTTSSRSPVSKTNSNKPDGVKKSVEKTKDKESVVSSAAASESSAPNGPGLGQDTRPSDKNVNNEKKVSINTPSTKSFDTKISTAKVSVVESRKISENSIKKSSLYSSEKTIEIERKASASNTLPRKGSKTKEQPVQHSNSSEAAIDNENNEIVAERTELEILQRKQSDSVARKNSELVESKTSVRFEEEESVDFERKESIDVERKESVDFERKECIDVERKESIVSERKESIDVERKESIDVERKESIVDERKESFGVERKESTVFEDIAGAEVKEESVVAQLERKESEVQDIIRKISELNEKIVKDDSSEDNQAGDVSKITMENNDAIVNTDDDDNGDDFDDDNDSVEGDIPNLPSSQSANKSRRTSESPSVYDNSSTRRFSQKFLNPFEPPCPELVNKSKLIEEFNQCQEQNVKNSLKTLTSEENIETSNQQYFTSQALNNATSMTINQALKLDSEIKDDKIGSYGIVSGLGPTADESDSMSCASETEIRSIRKHKLDLDFRVRDQEDEVDDLVSQVQMLETSKMKLELEITQMRKDFRREIESKEDELDDIRSANSKKVKTLEHQLEQEHDERMTFVREKHDLENKIMNLQDLLDRSGDEDLVIKLKKDLKRTKALLKDAQMFMEKNQSDGTNKVIVRQLKNQLEDAEFARSSAIKAKQNSELELADVQIQLDDVMRTKHEVDEKNLRLTREKADLQSSLNENEEELQEVMRRYKACVAAVSTDQITIQDQSLTIQTLECERNKLREQYAELCQRLDHLEGENVSTVQHKRLELKIRELESKLELEKTTKNRMDTQIQRQKELVEKMTREMDDMRMRESSSQDEVKKMSRQLRDLREEVANVQTREMELSHKKSDLEKQLELSEAETLTVKNELKIALRRIDDLQAAIGGEMDSDFVSDQESDSSSDDDMSSFIDNHRRSMSIQRERESILRKRDKPFECISEED